MHKDGMKHLEKNRGNPKKLLKFLNSDAFKERALAAHYLGELKSPEHESALIERLSDSVPIVVKAAALALEKIGAKESTKLLIQQRLSEIEDQEHRLQSKISEGWKPISEEEKEAQLRQYAAESHLRENRRVEINQQTRSIKNWQVASAVFLVIVLVYYVVDFLY